MDSLTTEDGKVRRPGDRVFNYYDGWWGTLGPIVDDGPDPWADVFGADGKRAYLNGARMSTYDPKGSVDPGAAVALPAPVTVDFPVERWRPIEGLDDPTSGLRGPLLIVNGLAMHVEAWAVSYDEENQTQVPDPEWEEEYTLLHGAVHADGSFETTDINGREYIVVITPHC